MWNSKRTLTWVFGWFRIGQSALSACLRVLSRRRTPFAPSAQHLHSRFIALYGRRATFCRKQHVSTCYLSIPELFIGSYSVRRRMKANLTRRRKGVKMVQAFEALLSASTCLPSVTATELATLRREAQAFKRVRAALRTHAPDQVAGRIVFQKASVLRQ